MLPKHCCPQDVEEADLFQITGQPDLDLVKIVLVQPGPRWGLEACSKATVWEPGLPSSDLAHSCSRTTLWGQTGSMCTEGGSAACGGFRGVLPGHRDLTGAVLSSWVLVPLWAPKGRRPSASTLSPWTAVGWTDGAHALPSGDSQPQEEGAWPSHWKRVKFSPDSPQPLFPHLAPSHPLTPCWLLHCPRPVGSAHVS